MLLNQDNVDKWARVKGHGCWQFYATTNEIQSVILESMNSNYEHYVFTGSDIVINPGETNYHQEPFEFAINELDTVYTYSNYSILTIWIRSYYLNPHLKLLPYTDVETICSYYGFIAISIGRKFKGAFEPWGISVVTHIANMDTNEIIEIHEYQKLYNRLKRNLRKILHYTTNYTDPEGVINKNCKDVLMSKGVVNNIKEGIEYKRNPGEKIN